MQEHGFNPWVRKIPWRRKWQRAPVFLPGKTHGGAWQTIVYGVIKGGQSLATKQLPSHST